MKISFLLFLSVFSMIPDAMAQVKETDTTSAKIVINKNIRPNQNPKKAALLSALIPGAGQIYNHKYWKAGLLYAGVTGIYFIIKFNDNRYQMYRKAYKSRLNGDTTNLDPYNEKNLLSNEPKYTDEDLVILKEFYRRDRDFSYIILALVYFCNIADAAVDAHLMQMEISDKLLLSFTPDIRIQNQYCIFTPKFTIGFKTNKKNANSIDWLWEDGKRN